jgi:peptide/nickel transport system substrate-binding protein
MLMFLSNDTSGDGGRHSDHICKILVLSLSSVGYSRFPLVTKKTDQGPMRKKGKMTKISQRLFAGAALLAATATLLAGCGGSSQSGAKSSSLDQTEPAAGFPSTYKGKLAMPSPSGRYNNPQPRSNIKDGGTYTYSSTYTPNWNEFSTEGNTSYMSNLWSWYQPSLAGFDKNDKLVWNKDYITSVKLKSTNPLTIVYDINPQAKWNDGSQISWEDFKSTWEVNNGKNTAYDPPSTEGYDQVKSVTRGKDDKEAVVTYAKPYYPWQIVFSGLYPHQAANPKTFTQGWVDNPHNEWAAGPYIVQSQNKDQVTFVRNPKWWGNKGKLDKIIVKYMESTAAINAFQNGELDDITFTTKQALKQAQARKDAQIRLGYSAQVDVIMLNGKSGALKNINVRKAFIQSQNFDELQKISRQGLNWTAPIPGSEVFFPFQKGYKDNRPKDSAFSTANAQKSLQAAGYKKGSDGYFQKSGKDLTLRYTYFSDTATANAEARAVQQMAKQAGIKINLDLRASAKFSDTVTQGDFEIMPMGWSGTNPYGQTSLTQLYASHSPSNFSFVGTKAVDKLLKLPGTIEDVNKAIEAGNTAEKAALKLYGTTPMDEPPTYEGVKKGLANVGPAGFLTVKPEDIGWQK